MFSRILIANRGEIACRIMRTARRMGIATVAVYSEAEPHALHVRSADEAVLLGPAPARDSYLAVDRVVQAALASGAEAVHPGYGFLAESAELAEACAANGLVFIGPPPAAIRAMASKSAAKTLMAEAGVPLIPGYHGDDQSSERLRDEATRVGYPVLIKASLGGGGKGMRRVDSEAEFETALGACRREAAAAFGDDSVLVEHYMERPRHIEVQVFADTHGNCVHLFERDCSVQRRHQKVLEEAPAPGVTPARRAGIGDAAVRAARAVGYLGAGTVEFVLAADGAFHFMEMNTRLQVEHPVTEMITGLDLVEWQLRVAAGEALPLLQEQLRIDGHALEARIYAEDPERGFLPATGRLVHLALPSQDVHVRVDTGVEQGDEIGPHYDPMIAKLIVWERDRERARARMLQALAGLRIAGVASNVEFLSRLVACPAFAAADLDTALIEREAGFLFAAPGEPPREAWLLAALATLLHERAHALALTASDAEARSPWHTRDGWRLNARAERVLTYRAGEQTCVVTVAYAGDGFVLEVAGERTLVNGEAGENGALRADLGGRRLDATVVVAGERRHVFLRGRAWRLASVDPLLSTGAGEHGDGSLLAPMPGVVVALLATPGARVARGAPLLVLEAMKMEHTVAAPAAGRLRAFRCVLGERVEDGAELVDFEPD